MSSTSLWFRSIYNNKAFEFEKSLILHPKHFAESEMSFQNKNSNSQSAALPEPEPKLKSKIQIQEKLKISILPPPL